MSQTFTISASTLMLAVPGLIALGGVVVGVALHGHLSTGIEVAQLNAVNDARTARWLFLRGYRKTPQAGPDITPEPEPPADDEDEVGDEQPGEATTSALMRPLLAVKRGADTLAGWFGTVFEFVAYLLKGEDAREREWREPAEGFVTAEEADARDAYRPAHWNDVTAMHELPYVGRRRQAEIPAQREGGDEA